MTETKTEKYPLLFSSLPLGKVTLRNRIVMAPMTLEGGVSSEQTRAFLAARAKGGVGLVMVGGVHIGMLEQAGFQEGLQKLAEAIHKEGAAAAVELFQLNRFGNEEVTVSKTENLRAATTEEVASIPVAFAEAARAIEAAGLDGAEVHGGHGFFFNQFFSPHFNHRDDRYGGSLLNRMRLGLETVEAMRQSVSSDFLLFYRHSPAEYFENGYDLPDTLVFAPELARLGLNVLDISPSSAPEPAPHAGLAAEVKRVVTIPVMAVGGMDKSAAAEKVLKEKKANLVAIGRGLLADAEWANKVKEGREDEIIGCDKVQAKILRLAQGLTSSCTPSPRAGFEFHDK